MVALDRFAWGLHMNTTLTASRAIVRAALHAHRALGRLRRRPVDVAAALCIFGFVACAANDDDVQPIASTTPGLLGASQPWLDVTTRILQDVPALRGFSFVVDGFHAERDDPSRQSASQLACSTVNDDLTQCLILDGERIVGVEYVVSARGFEKLSAAEQALWHPHNYEVLSGQLVAPGLPDVVERAVLHRFVNSWGKGVRLWNHGVLGHTADNLPVGEPTLLWSFNADGEINPQLVADRRRRLDVDTRPRPELVPEARPQRGVDALAASFPLRRPIEGVKSDEAPARLVDNWTSATTTTAPLQRQQ